MPTYKITDPATGLTLRLTGDSAPTEQELTEIFAKTAASRKPEGYEGGTTTGKGATGDFSETPASQIKQGIAQGIRQAMPFGLGALPQSKPELAQFLKQGRPALETAGMMGGGALAGAGSLGMASVLGAGLGYGATKTALDAAERWAQDKPQPGLAESAKRAAGDVATGATYEMGGQALGAGMKAAAETKPGQYILDKVGSGIANFLGITTNASPQAIKEAYRSGKEAVPDFGQAISKKVSGEDVVDAVKKAAANMKQARGVAYRERLKDISKMSGEIDMAPVHKRLSELMRAFNINRAGDGALDFSRSSLDASEVGKVGNVIDRVLAWGSRQGDTKPLMMDTLKQQVDDAMSTNLTKNSRAFVAGLRDSIKKSIIDQVPEYATMTEEYAKATRAINEAEKALSVRPGNMPETSLGKVINALKEDKEFRAKALDVLQEYTGQDLRALVAGKELSPYIPKGQLGALTRVGVLGAGVPFHPALAGALAPLASPHAVGRMAQGFGALSRIVPSLQPFVAPAALQATRMTGVEGE